MSNELTDKQLWEEYWKNYKFQPVSNKPIYHKYLSSLKGKKSFIEIGGFPGLNASFFYNNICKDVTLLDFYVEKTIINKVEQLHNIPADTIKCIESDFFAYSSDKRYDIVFSLGFIEHFADTHEVIKRHYDLLSEKGTLFIILPNLRGLNGAIQHLFDKENLSIHNLKSMDIPLLKEICKRLNLKNIKVEYTRKPMVWLEPKPGIVNKTGRILVKVISYFTKLFPIKGRFLSPYIVIWGEK